MTVTDAQHHREKARQAAERAIQLLVKPATMDSYDWALVAALLVEADEALERAQAFDSSVQLPLIGTAIDELRDVTSNFTNPTFLKASKAARRQRPNLFHQ